VFSSVCRKTYNPLVNNTYVSSDVFVFFEYIEQLTLNVNVICMIREWKFGRRPSVGKRCIICIRSRSSCLYNSPNNKLIHRCIFVPLITRRQSDRNTADVSEHSGDNYKSSFLKKRINYSSRFNCLHILRDV